MEYIVGNLLLGFVIGFVGLLLPNLRMIKMLDGQYVQVFFIHILAAIMTMVFTLLVAQIVIPFMVGNTIGGALAVSYLSYKKYKGQDESSKTLPR